ncbi:MAG: hypothetical protein WC375_13485, partial [Methanomassiliicoccales archaeon]
QKVNVTGPAEIDLTATVAKGIEMTMKHLGVTLNEVIKVTITDPISGATYITNTTAKGVVTAYMPEGNYSVIVDHRTTKSSSGDGSANYVRYTANMTLSFDETLEEISFALDRNYDNATVNGLVPGVEYHFEATSGSAITTVFTATSSSIDLAPGNYSVYAIDPAHNAFIGNIVVVPYIANNPSMVLVSGVSINGTIELAGNAVSGSVKIISQTGAYYEFESDANGTYQAWLPSGAYTVNATAEQIDSGVTVTYSGSVQVVLTAATVQDITVTKVVEHSVSLAWDAIKGTVGPGESVTYNVRVKNTGNMMDSYKLSAAAKGWNISISETDLENITYGENGSVNVTVTLTPDSTVEVDHASVVLNARSSIGSGAAAKLALDANISPRYNITVNYTASNSQNATIHTYKYRITNSGNVDDKYTVDISNAEEIHSKGWNVTMRVGTSGLYSQSLNISVNSGNHRDIEVSLVAIVDDPDPNVNITFSVQSQGDVATVRELSLAAALPSLTIPDDGFVVDGTDVDLSRPEIPSETYIAFTAIVLLAALAIFLTFKKGVLGRRK